jgi:hypothetical protein
VTDFGRGLTADAAIGGKVVASKDVTSFVHDEPAPAARWLPAICAVGWHSRCGTQPGVPVSANQSQ